MSDESKKIQGWAGVVLRQSSAQAAARARRDILLRRLGEFALLAEHPSVPDEEREDWREGARAFAREVQRVVTDDAENDDAYRQAWLHEAAVSGVPEVYLKAADDYRQLALRRLVDPEFDRRVNRELLAMLLDEEKR